MGHRSRPEPRALTRQPSDLPPIIITCWNLAVIGGSKGDNAAWYCKHSANDGCDLRVVGLTTYGLGNWREQPKYPKKLPNGDLPIPLSLKPDRIWK